MENLLPYRLEMFLIGMFPFTKEETIPIVGEYNDLEFSEMNAVLDKAHKLINNNSNILDIVKCSLGLTVGKSETSKEVIRDFLKEIRFGEDPLRVITEGEKKSF